MFQKKRKNESAPVTNRMDTQDNGDALFETLNKTKKATVSFNLLGTEKNRSR